MGPIVCHALERDTRVVLVLYLLQSTFLLSSFCCEDRMEAGFTPRVKNYFIIKHEEETSSSCYVWATILSVLLKPFYLC